MLQQPEEYTSGISGCEAAIIYAPLSDEPDPLSLGIPLPTLRKTVSPLRDTNPFALAAEYAKEFAGKRVCILIPGRAFDSSGTRHGRGGGWYDRFLSAVPREWLRIGVCREKDFSETRLDRQAHDEPVDLIVIAASSGPRVVPAENTRVRT
jgi:5-formyltetrahydrofolate cyclo-ligase